MTPHLFGIPVEFFLFALTLLGVALFHKHTMYVALTGLVIILAFKLLTAPDFSLLHHLAEPERSMTLAEMNRVARQTVITAFDR